MHFRGGFEAETGSLVGLASGQLLGQQGRSCAHPTQRRLGVRTLTSLAGEPLADISILPVPLTAPF